ncbi:MAG TPA: DUF2961 domain-containing protein [Polyangiaceae bacterium]|nr:DUF2961 domain-containing protein [Polyangiaceae bacterium]
MRPPIPHAIALLVVGCTGGGASHTSVDSGGAPDAASMPVVPVVSIGPDAYRDWEKLPEIKLGARTYMRSTFDRAGGNEGADASHFLRMDTPDRAVAMDVTGAGYLYFARANHWHGSPWHYAVDGTDVVVQESSTADPTNPVAGSTFLPASAFPSPLALTWSVTQGADLSWVPVGFESSFTLSYERTHYGSGYFIYQLYADAEGLSRAPQHFTLDAPDPAIATVLDRAGENLAPASATVQRTTVDVPANAAVDLFRPVGSRTVRSLVIRVSKAQASALADVHLRITWDGRHAPSIDAPLPLFFGAGTLFNRTGAEWLVKALLFGVHFDTDDVSLATYFPMPFFKGAQVELVGGGTAVTGVSAELGTVPNEGDVRTTGYFHATYVDHGVPESGKDLVALDTTTVEGGGDFCGSFAGMSFVFSDRAELSTLEGDPRFFFDDSDTPQGQGTGTEEWAGGGDYWGGQTMTLPLAGHPVGAPSATAAMTADDAVEGAYRLLVADAMPFGKNARIQLEHGGADDSTEHYRTVAYWYGVPGACLVQTDALHVGDTDDEAAHAYVSPSASTVDSITSRYELGVDHVGATEIYPATTDTGRHMTGTTEFRVKLDPRNLGALLRRKLDYAYPDQRADVFVAEDRDGAPFTAAGTWYLAGSNSVVYSNPPGETDPAVPLVETSNRRFRDDEFLVPRRLTVGRSAVRIRIVFRPLTQPLLPGGAPATTAWSELRYSVYSWVVPGIR